MSALIEAKCAEVTYLIAMSVELLIAFLLSIQEKQVYHWFIALILCLSSTNGENNFVRTPCIASRCATDKYLLLAMLIASITLSTSPIPSLIKRSFNISVKYHHVL
ncbi:hypothetical protein KC19_2G216800 [Ceratodon purpureus]|uniref:Uncharacterized protein n=1 Tax=Ceratodon purpureus TaxID=3225 RepID=A0A8T0IWL2_CERPU|nr:hypothetical protein KC19_2G216800 [Ceratodon purpureus]